MDSMTVADLRKILDEYSDDTKVYYREDTGELRDLYVHYTHSLDTEQSHEGIRENHGWVDNSQVVMEPRLF
jgi:uncharacterized protein YtpQ (UPF0354 family)